MARGVAIVMRAEQHCAVAPGAALAVRVGNWVAALPVADVVETMRPLPIEAVAGAPPAVRGLARIRGEVLPVVELAAVLGQAAPSTCARFVTVRAGDRTIALAVEAVLGLVATADLPIAPRPPMLGEACEAIAGVAPWDHALFALLNAATLVPPDLWAQLGLDETP